MSAEFSSDDVSLALGLTFASGLATTIGAALPFCVDIEKHRWVLGAALASSAGVMLYISFVEILYKSLDSWIEIGHSKSNAHLLTSACFFGGIILMALLNMLVHKCLKHGHSDPLLRPTPADAAPGEVVIEMQPGTEVGKATAAEIKQEPKINDAVVSLTTSSIDLGVLHLEPSPDHVCGPNCQIGTIPRRVPSPRKGSPALASAEYAVETQDEADKAEGSDQTKSTQSAGQLIRTGVFTALAVGLHNFPEGLATFLGTLADPKLGASIAVAIAIHNIPEGIAVAMPIYYASGSKWKAFLLAFGSGVAEPIGGLIGYGIMYQALGTAELYGVAFGIISGMMIFIALKELLPMARKQDPKDNYVTWCAIAGFVVMDASLILFKVASEPS